MILLILVLLRDEQSSSIFLVESAYKVEAIYFTPDHSIFCRCCLTCWSVEVFTCHWCIYQPACANHRNTCGQTEDVSYGLFHPPAHRHVILASMSNNDLQQPSRPLIYGHEHMDMATTGTVREDPIISHSLRKLQTPHQIAKSLLTRRREAKRPV